MIVLSNRSYFDKRDMAIWWLETSNKLWGKFELAMKASSSVDKNVLGKLLI